MSIYVLLPVIGVILLLVLVPLVMQQRRTASVGPQLLTDEAPVRPLQPPRENSFVHVQPPSLSPSLTTGQVALGVFLGLWAFAISAGIIGYGVSVALLQQWRGH